MGDGAQPSQPSGCCQARAQNSCQAAQSSNKVSREEGNVSQVGCQNNDCQSNTTGAAKKGSKTSASKAAAAKSAQQRARRKPPHQPASPASTESARPLGLHCWLGSWSHGQGCAQSQAPTASAHPHGADARLAGSPPEAALALTPADDQRAPDSPSPPPSARPLAARRGRRPLAARVVALSLMVCCSLRIVQGLKATRITIGSPLPMPP